MNSFNFPTKFLITGVFAAAFTLTNVAYAAHRCEDYGLKKLGMHVVPEEGGPAIAVADFVADVRNKKSESTFINTLLGGERSISEITGLLVELRNDPVNFNTDCIIIGMTCIGLLKCKLSPISIRVRNMYKGTICNSAFRHTTIAVS